MLQTIFCITTNKSLTCTERFFMNPLKIHTYPKLNLLPTEKNSTFVTYWPIKNFKFALFPLKSAININTKQSTSTSLTFDGWKKLLIKKLID